MEKADFTILSTRPLSELTLQEAAAKGFLIDCLSFIETEPIRNEAVAEKVALVAAQNAAVVFTSMNAVEAVHHYIRQRPSWRVYAIGNTSKQLAEAYFSPVCGTAESAGALAEIIIRNGETAVTFFCGDIRRDELPDKLKEAGIAVDEVMVYHTVLLPHRVTKSYDGVLFFSPSAVHAFFEHNTLPPATTLFAIGPTTAAAINTYTNNNIYVADSPSKEQLVRDAMLLLRNPKNQE